MQSSFPLGNDSDYTHKKRVRLCHSLECAVISHHLHSPATVSPSPSPSFITPFPLLGASVKGGFKVQGFFF